MQKIEQVSGPGLPLLLDDIDTDRIIPARYLRCVTFDGIGEHAFEDDRQQDPNHPFNKDVYQNASVLVARRNFGCGSSREHAVWALMESGFRAVIAPSFATIFRNNALRNGLLTVALAQHDLDELVAWVSADPAANAIQLDLKACTIESDPEKEKKVFSIDPTARDMLLKGLDEIGLTEQSMDLVSRFEEQDQARRPWVYLASD